MLWHTWVKRYGVTTSAFHHCIHSCNTIQYTHILQIKRQRKKRPDFWRAKKKAHSHTSAQARTQRQSKTLLSQAWLSKDIDRCHLSKTYELFFLLLFFSDSERVGHRLPSKIVRFCRLLLISVFFFSPLSFVFSLISLLFILFYVIFWTKSYSVYVCGENKSRTHTRIAIENEQKKEKKNDSRERERKWKKEKT